MTASPRREARSLIIVSNAYGELGLAMSLLRGQTFASRARMLLPDRLYSDNKDTLTVSASRYATREDILAVVDSHEPDLVFLLSGYLFSHERLLSPDSLGMLVRQLRNRGCRVITSDPFLGLAPHVTVSQMDTRLMLSGTPPLSRWLMRLVLRLRGMERQVLRVPCLEDVVHVYPTSVPDTDGDDRVLRFSFFNPTMVGATTDSSVLGNGGDTGHPDNGCPRWLFVLSSADLNVQRTLLGLGGFARLLVRMLQRTLDAGRRPTLIAPPSIVKALSKGLPDEFELLASRPFAEFERRLLDAEYVFYWNALSFSVLPRVTNQLPVFVFDQGYMGRTIGSYYQVAISCHFGGWVPPYLDQKQSLDPSTLADLAEKQKLAMRVLRERWLSSATPDEVVEQLLGES